MTVPPDRFLTEESQLYIGDFEIVRVPASPNVEFVASKVGWKGFQSSRFTLQLEIYQGTTSLAREQELPPVQQPYAMQEKVLFLVPVRDVTWGRRGTPQERMNLHRDFEVCFRLLEGLTEAELAEQCYKVSGEQVSRIRGQRVTLAALEKDTDATSPTGEDLAPEKKLPPGIPGSYLTTSELPGMGMGVLALKSKEALWTPADSGAPIQGSWEIQGQLILVRFESKKGLLLLRPTENGWEELNSGIKLRSVD
ncbi:MAG: hypothetical protein CMF59_00440 [Leptospiraceae bacterium]|nr:hypothetical protein [Leptospiraceae bacterium]